jgi:hypothetical protein
MSKPISGIVRGKIIELDEDPGFEPSQAVSVNIQAVVPPKPGYVWGDGIRASAGAFADDPDAERTINEILAARRCNCYRENPE